VSRQAGEISHLAILILLENLNRRKSLIEGQRWFFVEPCTH
jgi:hypothetical protein